MNDPIFSLLHAYQRDRAPLPEVQIEDLAFERLHKDAPEIVPPVPERVEDRPAWRTLAIANLAGVPLGLSMSNRFIAPPPVEWVEVDRAIRFAAGIAGITWPPTWNMLELGAGPTDYIQIWVGRAQYYLANLSPRVLDPFVQNTLPPLLAKAKARFAYQQAIALNPPAGSTMTVAYEDTSPLGVQLSALMSQATELATFLTTP